MRTLYLATSRESPFFEPLLLDPGYYDGWAKDILKGRFSGAHAVFYGLPLYPFFVAASYAVSQTSVFFVKILQIAFGMSTLYFVYKTGEKLVSTRVGLAAMAIAALYGPLFFHEQIFIPESLGVPLYAAAFYGALLFLEKPSFGRGLLTGTLIGLAALCKAGILLFAALWVTFKALRQKTYLAVGLGVLLMLAPVTIYNAVHGQDFVWLTSHGGFNFYIGNNPEAEGVFKAPQGTGSGVQQQIEDSETVAEAALGRALKPSEVSRYWSERAWVFIRENPGDFLALLAKKLALFFDAREISDLEDYVFCRRFSPVLRLPWIDFAVLGPLVFAGLLSICSWRRQRITVFWIALYLFGVVSFFVNARYRLPVLPIFFVLGAASLFDAWRFFKEKKTALLIAWFLLAGAGVAVGQLRLVDTDHSRDYVSAGDAYQLKGQWAEAIGFYEQALERNPGYAKAYLGLGVTHTKMEKHDEARRYYEKVITLDPHNVQALNNLGMGYDRAGDFAQARRYFEAAYQANPRSARTLNNLGMAYGKLGDYAAAEKYFRKSLEIDPDYPKAQANLQAVLDQK